MLPDNNPTAKVKLDSYSILICSKYFKEETDFVNLVCVCKKFKETTEKLRFNPISVNSLKLFPKIQTQLLYTEDDTMIEGIDNYEILYEVSYDQYLNFRQNNIKCHYVVYTKENSQQFGDNVLVGVNMLGDKCFSYHSSLLKINIPSTIISLGRKCFGYHRSLQSITLPSSLKSLNDECFIGCFSLTSINLPSTLTSLGNRCFFNCYSLMAIDLPFSLLSINDECFHYCWKLKSVDLPESITSLGKSSFGHCGNLTRVTLPTTLKSIDIDCFMYCRVLQTINIPSSITNYGIGCFCGCQLLEGNIPVPDKCFYESEENMINSTILTG